MAQQKTTRFKRRTDVALVATRRLHRAGFEDPDAGQIEDDLDYLAEDWRDSGLSGDMLRPEDMRGDVVSSTVGEVAAAALDSR